MKPLACLAALLVPLAAFGKDQALVVGINYTGTKVKPTLYGPENDARDMATFCRAQGYELPVARLLIGKQATKDAIMAGLADLQRAAKGKDRVIVYFAGHGFNRNLKSGGKPDCCLLPYDFVLDHYDTAIGTNDLYRAVRAIPTTGNRSVILDSCYSGGMARDLRFRTRSFSPYRSRSVVPVLPSDDQSQSGVPADGTGKVCYLTAAKANEQALEIGDGPQAHGLFTQALLSQLKKGDQTCEDASAAVRTSIAKKIAGEGSSRKQTPDVTGDFLKLPVLKGTLATLPPPAKPPTQVWDLIAKERPDPKRLTLAVEPRPGALLVGQALKMSVKAGRPGFLVVVWSMGSDRINLQVPQPSANGELLPVALGKDESAPLYKRGTDGQFFVNAGGNRMTAFLFDDEARAQDLVDALAGGKPRTVEELQAKGLLTRSGRSDDYTTAGLSFEVGDQLPGGFVVKDAPALFDALNAPGPFELAFQDRVNAKLLAALTAERQAMANPKAFGEAVTLMVNDLLDSLGKRMLVDAEATGLNPAQLKAAKDAAKRLEAAKPEDAAAIQAGLLAILLPKCVGPTAEGGK